MKLRAKPKRSHPSRGGVGHCFLPELLTFTVVDAGLQAPFCVITWGMLKLLASEPGEDIEWKKRRNENVYY